MAMKVTLMLRTFQDVCVLSLNTEETNLQRLLKVARIRVEKLGIVFKPEVESYR